MTNTLDITEGFVLNDRQALEYLQEVAAGFYKEAAETGEDCGEAVEDCANMAHMIQTKGWRWILFQNCDMAPSNINIKEVMEG